MSEVNRVLSNRVANNIHIDDFNKAMIVVAIRAKEEYVLQLQEKNERLIEGIRDARHCLTYGEPPVEGGRFDIGTTYLKLSILLGE